MKKIIISFLVLFSLLSCNSIDYKQGVDEKNILEVINNENNVLTGATNIESFTWGINSFTWDINSFTWDINSDDFIWGVDFWSPELSIEQKIKMLISEEDIFKLIDTPVYSDVKDEITKIDSYYTEESFYEFFILNSVKNKDIEECKKINQFEKIELCEDLFNNQNSRDEIVRIYSNNGEDEEWAISMYTVFNYIKENNTDCTNDSFSLYLACKKILDENYDVEKNFLYYSRLEASNKEFIKINYKDIIKYWWLDKWFLKIVENNLINNEI